MKERFGRTRLEKIEELLSEYIKFRDYDYNKEDKLLRAKVNSKREELRINDKEWHSVLMLKKVQKRRGMEHF